MSHNCANIISPDMRYPFDARGVAKRFRHAAIFGALDHLFRDHGRLCRRPMLQAPRVNVIGHRRSARRGRAGD